MDDRVEYFNVGWGSTQKYKQLSFHPAGGAL